MPDLYSPDSPVVHELRRVLREKLEGLKIPALHRALVRGGFTAVVESDVDNVVRSILDFLILPDGTVVLREMVETEGSEEEDVGPTPEPFRDEPSTLRESPSLDAYVLFDVETTALEPEKGDFFQLSAVKVVNGEAVDAANWFSRVDMKTLTVALREKLHFRQLNLEEKIARAGGQVEVVAEFLAFADGLPLVAHNGTFDRKFLCKHLPVAQAVSLRPDDRNLADCVTVVDALELICLAFPEQSSHSLERLAVEPFQFVAKQGGSYQPGPHWAEVEQLAEKLQLREKLDAGDAALHDLFHSALFDCLILHLVFRAALEELERAQPAFRAHVRALCPALGDIVDAPPTPDAPPKELHELITLQPANHPTAQPPAPPVTFDENAVMDFYRRLGAKAEKWERRESQETMLREVTRLLDEGGKTMIESPTGTGKTLAYALPVLVYAKATKQQVTVSTSTKNLQDQLVGDLEKKVKPVAPFDFTYAVLKGRENYLCLTRLWDGFQEAFYGDTTKKVPFEEKLSLLYLLRLAERTQDTHQAGDLQGVSFW